MGEVLKQRLQQTRFESPVQEAVLNLMVAAASLDDRMSEALAPHGITPAQYNVLRILRGASPDGYARCEIARRALRRAPDLTRLIDRLERRRLVGRARSEADRRRSVTRITRRGLELLERATPAVRAVQSGIADRLNERDARELSRLCELLYEDAG
ncbi:MAG: MarR family winged helix-turn-helix transcriptional regulator [Candidatus Eisenbacteria bacterium]